jgi:hypothetical protein
MTDPILSDPTVTRREACRVAGTAALFGTSALAGCLNDDGGTAEDEGGDGDTNDGTETNDTDAEERENLAIQFAGPQGAAMTIPTRLIRDEGFAEDRGLDLDLKMMPPPAIQQAIAAEEIESGTFPVIPGARLANEGRNVRLLGPVCQSFNSIIVHEDTDVDDLEDLQNVTLGSMPRTSAPWTHFALLASMEGFDPDSYDYRTGPPATLFGAIQQGDIEAMIGVEPFSSRLLATGEFEPYLVEDWEMAADGTSFTLTVTDGHTWADGTPVTIHGEHHANQSRKTHARNLRGTIPLCKALPNRGHDGVPIIVPFLLRVPDLRVVQRMLL